jgi:hypothetical protein
MKRIHLSLFTLVALLLLPSFLAAQQWKFIVYGDTRSNDAAHRSVLTSIKGNTPDFKFIINVGDVVSAGSSSSDWTTWSNAMTAVFGSTLQDGTPPKYMAVNGNHDAAAGSGQVNWRANLSGQYQQFGPNTFYCFDYNDARFILLDSENSVTGQQRTMLLDAIQKNPKKWLFTVWHTPIFDFGPKSYNATVHTSWGIPLYQNGCDLMFMGHAHYYIKTRKLALNGAMNPPLDAERGIVQCVTGNGGAPPYSINSNEDNNAYMIDGTYTNGNGYTEITINGDTATLKHILANGTVFDTQTHRPNPKTTTAIHTLEEEVPTECVLHDVYPNPFNPSTTISFAVPQSGMYSLKVYNILGDEVAVLLNYKMPAGFHKVNFSPGNLSSGTYIYRLSGNNVDISKRMTYLK